jgi:hypothetical protein
MRPDELDDLVVGAFDCVSNAVGQRSPSPNAGAAGRGFAGDDVLTWVNALTRRAGHSPLSADRRPKPGVPIVATNQYSGVTGVVRAKFQVLGAAIEPLRLTRKNAGKSMATKSGSDVLAK